MDAARMTRRALLVTNEPGSEASSSVEAVLSAAFADLDLLRVSPAALLSGDALELAVLDARGSLELALSAASKLREAAPALPIMAIVEGSGAAALIGAGVDECCALEVNALERARELASARRRATLLSAQALQGEHERAREARLSRHNEILRALAEQLSADDLDEHLTAITEAAARTLDVARTSVWLLDADQKHMRTLDAFDQRTGEHRHGAVLSAKDHPAYFRALGEQRVVLANDAREDPVTRSLRAAYLDAHDIHSLMAAPVRVGSRFLGVLCHEQVGATRKFTDEDATAASSLADFIAIAIESREHHRAEEALRTSNAKLDEARRIEAVGRLAGGVAHDFNNVITVVSSYAFLLAKKLDKNDALQVPVAEIAKAAERAADITRKLLALSRREPGAPRVFDLNNVVRGMEIFLKRLIGEHITLRIELCAQPLMMFSDPGQVEQIILNLIVNARDAARPEGSTITVRTLFDASSKKKAERPCALEVSDTGVGMTPEVQARIFEPFFTTKDVGKGSGLGLFTVWGAVSQMSGTVEVKSTPNKGTRFTLRFAQAAPEVSTSAAPPDRKELMGTETLLLVEDEAQVRDVTALILRDFGYRVLEAANIDEALTHARANRDISALVSDIVMPKASGTVVAARIKELIPSLRVLFISGYNKEMLSAYDASLGPTLPKPFTAEQLGRKVREIIDAKDLTSSGERSAG